MLGFLGSIIAQLIQGKVGTLNILESLYNNVNSSLIPRNLLPSDVWKLEDTLHAIIRKFFRIIIVIDALDECAEQDDIFRVVERLRGLRNLSLLVTSRDQLEIRLQFTNLSILSIKKDDVSVDIENFVSSELQRQPKLVRLKFETKSDITAALVKGSKGM